MSEKIGRSSENGNKVEQAWKERPIAETGGQDSASTSGKLLMSVKAYGLNRFKGTGV